MQIWAESGKSALPICNYSQILYQFLTFTQNLKRSPSVMFVCCEFLTDNHVLSVKFIIQQILTYFTRNELSRTFYQKNKQQYYLLHYACCVCHLAV